jgi:dCMP deaminase
MQKNTLKWDQRYLKLAQQIAQWSRDPSSKIGAIAVGSKGQVLSQGFNGFPRGLEDNHNRLVHRETKYKFTVHAEMNVIYNASYNGTSLDGSTLYVYGLPICSECAKGIIQVGIRRVVMPTQNIDPRWLDSWIVSKEFFEETAVEYEFIDLEQTT